LEQPSQEGGLGACRFFSQGKCSLAPSINDHGLEKMGTNTFIELDMPVAANLAALTGIRQDLQGAITFLDILQNLDAQLANWVEIADALTTAALIRYGRPFGPGSRPRLDLIVGKLGDFLTEDQLRTHLKFVGYRNKFAAHSVNDFEENQPHAHYWVEKVAADGITSISCQSTRVLTLSGKEMGDLSQISKTLLEHVDEFIRAEKEVVLAAVRKIPIEVFLPKSGH